jgi:hypothetical protein
VKKRRSRLKRRAKRRLPPMSKRKGISLLVRFLNSRRSKRNRKKLSRKERSSKGRVTKRREKIAKVVNLRKKMSRKSGKVPRKSLRVQKRNRSWYRKRLKRRKNN